MNEQFIKALADITRSAIGKALEPISKRLEALENTRNDIDILPCIDLEKSYGRGVYAMHNGGLWKSYQNTNGIRGWDCLVNGVAAITITPTSERDFEIKTALSDGAESTNVLTVPALIYKGVYKDDCEYSKGDVVTQGGSMWSCGADTKEKPANGCNDWTLCVKHGRDARAS